EYDAVLRDVNWATIGADLAALPPLVHELGEASAAGRPPNFASIGKIQKNLGEIFPTASKVVDRIPGSGAYRAFTHPPLLGDAIAATLDAAKVPLSDEQAGAVEAVGRDYDARDAARMRGYDERTWALQKEIDEGALKDRFFEAALAALSPAQRDALCMPSTRGL